MTHRDQIKRLGTLLLVMMICWTFANQTLALVWAVVVVGGELLLHLVNRRVKMTGPQIPNQTAFWSWMLNWSCMSLQLVPAVFLAHSGSAPLFAVSLIWLFALFSHVGHTYAALPFHHASLIFSLIITTVSAFVVAAMAPVMQGDWLAWISAGAVLIIYVINTFETTALRKAVISDLDDARREADKRLEELEFLNQHDTLTGLLNRQAFDDAAIKLLPRGSSSKGHLAYFLLDLDGFKPINDSYSHTAGDAVLVGISDRIRRFVGERGVVARLGGDEFAVVMPNISDADHAIKIGEEMAALVEVPMLVDHKQLSVGGSIGIALTANGHNTITALAQGADQAMYQAKSAPGRNAILFDKVAFPPRATLDDKEMIKRAMKKQQLEPYFQPKVCLSTGEIRGFEALSRWRHPKRGLLLPAKFLPSIDELGLHRDFLMHTTELVLQQVTEMVKDGLDPGQVSVNVPEVTLATLSARAEVLDLIDSYPVARTHLTFEVTEDVFIARSGNLIQESIAMFRAAGVRVSLDDFGTGFASFKHLRELEFDELKLDTAFVRDIGKKHDADVLVQGFLNIGKGLGVTVIAEGVETTNQLGILRRMGCGLAQGFLFGKAQPFAETRVLLATQQRKRKAKNVGESAA